MKRKVFAILLTAMMSVQPYSMVNAAEFTDSIDVVEAVEDGEEISEAQPEVDVESENEEDLQSEEPEMTEADVLFNSEEETDENVISETDAASVGDFDDDDEDDDLNDGNITYTIDGDTLIVKGTGSWDYYFYGGDFSNVKKLLLKMELRKLQILHYIFLME